MDRNEMMAKYLGAKIDEDVFKEVLKIYRIECEKARVSQLKSLQKNRKRKIKRNGRTKLLR